MTIRSVEELKGRKPQIDLTGPEGNVYVLFGYAKNFHRDLKESGMIDISFEDLLEEMKEDGDYEGVLKVFDKYFGAYVDLYR